MKTFAVWFFAIAAGVFLGLMMHYKELYNQRNTASAQWKAAYEHQVFLEQDLRRKYDSLVKITEMPNIFNHDGILEESHPNRDITGPPTSIRLDSDLKISKNQ